MPTINREGQVVICIKAFDDDASNRVAERYGIPKPTVGARYIVKRLEPCRNCNECHMMALEGMMATRPDSGQPGQAYYHIAGYFQAEEIKRSPEIGGLIAIANGAVPSETVEDKALYRRPAIDRRTQGQPGKLRVKIMAEFQRSPVLLDIDGSILSGKLRARAAAFAGVHSVAALVLGDESEWPATLILQPWRIRS